MCFSFLIFFLLYLINKVFVICICCRKNVPTRMNFKKPADLPPPPPDRKVSSSKLQVLMFVIILSDNWKFNLPMAPYVLLFVGRLVSVCHNFPKGREVTLPLSYRSTGFSNNSSNIY